MPAEPRHSEYAFETVIEAQLLQYGCADLVQLGPRQFPSKKIFLSPVIHAT